MAEIINLRLARKRKARAGNEAQAARNRLAHGRSKAETALDEARRDKAGRDLDGHRRETRATGPEDGDGPAGP